MDSWHELPFSFISPLYLKIILFNNYLFNNIPCQSSPINKVIDYKLCHQAALEKVHLRE